MSKMVDKVLYILVLFSCLHEGNCQKQARSKVWRTSRYWVSNEMRNWADSEQHCKKLGGHLVSLHSKEENSVVKSMLQRNYSYWTGFNDRDNEGVFIWTDGSAVDYRDWSNKMNEPNGGTSENCGHYSRAINVPSQKWDDSPCDGLKKYICKISAYIISNDAKPWDEARKECMKKSADLVTIDNTKEFEHIKTLIKGTGHDYWIGLKDIKKDSSYTWIAYNSTEPKFTHWSPQQPKNQGNEECVQLRSYFAFNGSCRTCNTLRKFICEKDNNECYLGSHNCDAKASCQNLPGSFKCTCRKGYTGNGTFCTDVNECVLGKHNCHQKATCQNGFGNFTCICKAGFTGDGVNCTDIDECALGNHNCDTNADCKNTLGSFSCTCMSGYLWNGINCTDLCPDTYAAGPKTNHNFHWKRSKIGTSVKVPCPNSAKNNASRNCSDDLRWSPVNDAYCKLTSAERAERLRDLDKISINSSNVEDVSKQLLLITGDNSSGLTSKELQFATNILEKLMDFAGAKENVYNDVVDIVDNFLYAAENEIAEGQRKSNISTRVLEILGKVGEAYSYIKNGDHKRIKNNYALASTLSNQTSYRGISLFYIFSDLLVDKSYNRNDDNTTVSISLPPSLLQSANTSSTSKGSFVFLVYTKTKFFQTKEKSQLKKKIIISAQLRDYSINNLVSPVKISFGQLTNPKTEGSSCAWWDFSKSDGQGDWSTEGCRLEKIIGDKAICHCNHLTNFALLFSSATDPPTDRIELTHKLVLEVITYVGCAMSLAGSALTLFTYSIFRSLRNGYPSKILMNLCIAYILFLTAFMAGCPRTETKDGCQASAFLIQYFMLAVFCWSAVEAFSAFRAIVFPFAKRISMFMRKTMAFAWGLPAVLCAVGFGIWRDNYGNQHSCTVNGTPLYATLVAPAALVLLLNVVGLIIIIYDVGQRPEQCSENLSSLKFRLRVAAGLSTLFGVAWVFGFLVVLNDNKAFQYLFCILATLNGFFIFLFYCIRNKNAREAWKGMLKKLLNADEHPDSSSVGSSSTLRTRAKTCTLDISYPASRAKYQAASQTDQV